MNREHVKERLTDYLLGEVSVPERDAIRAHLVSCRDCAAEEAALRRAITWVEAALRSGRPAPEDFTERVMRRIGTAPPATLPATFPATRFTRKPRAWGWAAALTAALIVGTVLLHPLAPRAPKSGPAVTLIPKSGPAVTLTLPAMLAVYREASRAPQVPAPPRPAEIAAALTPQAGFPVAPVDLAAWGALSRGGCVCRLQGRPAAVAVLAYHGRTLTLSQMPSWGVTLPDWTAMTVPGGLNTPGPQILCGRSGNCRLVAWRSAGRVFVLAGNVLDRELVRLARAVPTPAAA